MATGKIGGQEVHAEYIADNFIKLVSPATGANTQNVVTVANADSPYGDVYYAQTEATYATMESALYIDGSDDAGFEADSICEDLPKKTVTFGGWVCPNCGPEQGAINGDKKRRREQRRRNLQGAQSHTNKISDGTARMLSTERS